MDDTLLLLNSNVLEYKIKFSNEVALFENECCNTM